ncbi:MAG TPA: class I tRNA ligase family protein, partial [Planctomycetota bacterium]|nr:class I tRNA ligase family protein [Planctomycetota bacterium]
QAKWHLVKTMDTFLRMMHPIMPFLTEELWQTLKNQLPEHTLGTEEACIIAPWPDATQFPTNKESLQIVELAREISAAINNIRAEQKLKPSEKIAEAYIASTNNAMLEKLQNLSIGVQKLTKVEKIYITSNMEKPDKTASRVLSDILVYIPLAGMMDIEKEKEKLNQEIHKLQEQIARLETKLANTEYTSKAPAQVVEKDRNKLADMQKRSQQWQEQLQSL